MRLRFAHAESVAFEVLGSVGTEPPDGQDDTPESGDLTDCLVAFVGVHGTDAGNLDGVTAAAGAALRDHAEQLNTSRVLLYPDANLLEEPVDSSLLQAAMQRLDAAVSDELCVLRVPVGRNVALDLDWNGHPIADVTRRVMASQLEQDGPSSTAGEWSVLLPDGDRLDTETTSLPDVLHDSAVSAQADPITTVLDCERGNEPIQQMAASRERWLSDAGLATGDSLAETGHLRWSPAGTVVRETLLSAATNRLSAAGGNRIHTPRIYNLAAPAVGEFAGTIRGEHYHINSNSAGRRLLLSPDASLGLLSAVADLSLTAERLPVKVYERECESVRSRNTVADSDLESGSGSGPGAGFGAETGPETRPTMLTAVAGEDAVREAVSEQAKLVLNACLDLGVVDVVTLRVTETFHDADSSWIESLATDLEHPIVLERRDSHESRWQAKLSVVAVRGLDRPVELGAVVLDRDNAIRFDVAVDDDSTVEDAADTDDQLHRPRFVHCSPIGSVETAISAILARGEQNTVSGLPTWLVPTQVRLVPITSRHHDTCLELADKLQAASVRADIDDRNLPVATRLAKAKDDGVPYVTVIGDRERDHSLEDVLLKVTHTNTPNTTSTTNIDTESELKLSIEALIDSIDDAVGDRPRPPRPGPQCVSKQLHLDSKNTET